MLNRKCSTKAITGDHKWLDPRCVNKPERFLEGFRLMSKTSLFFFMLLPITVLAQNHRQNADSVVAFFLGDDVFQRYVSLDTKQSKRLAFNAHLFQYNFRHPIFSGETFVISFTLDSTGRFTQSEEIRGLIHMLPDSDSAWINARQALDICRDQAYRIKKRSLRLAWDPTAVSFDVFQKTNDFRDIVPGHLVWEVDGEVIFRGHRYSGTFEVNVLTGTVGRRFAIPWD